MVVAQSGCKPAILPPLLWESWCGSPQLLPSFMLLWFGLSYLLKLCRRKQWPWGHFVSPTSFFCLFGRVTWSYHSVVKSGHRHFLWFPWELAGLSGSCILPYRSPLHKHLMEYLSQFSEDLTVMSLWSYLSNVIKSVASFIVSTSNKIFSLRCCSLLSNMSFIELGKLFNYCQKCEKEHLIDIFCSIIIKNFWFC